ncbi:MAG: 50S ribosomal protein L4 [Candidatus Daviesbacteria bacterium GW2011_GWA2_38_24]|uniref:Large ribosomal subunit protein uL4 n=1 Tax=Candidatus Daviesbacteria bacterium GW2011_GWA2_38_24 TaxID=1618422 RepID=A0A0G0M194_9BACT|nr:MAG: 50S ribosomal protein L4 [Candidatus Daviesbacteria bacterium GW2011_GWA2_38_24]KKQ78401.1 MAG: 50S ribosomal protein L4 [Candidatus Daviesbacteria bacterium GW2011_GWA1_38_7]OGE24527.1 MAG: 50S ribosomal protein L4 [Candidatus Daviesbacteria bacterium RIFCSPHIGHO2_01_FULL_38_8]
MAVKKATAKKAELTIPAYSLKGEEVGEVSVPEEVFGVRPNKQLLSQALRVYINNQTGHFAHTKTRGEVDGSTRKIYKQKGTGRARHGGVRAPIFVGGGVALGPRKRDVVLSLPKAMKRLALKSALSVKLADKQLAAIKDLEKATGKTKEIAALLNKLNRKSVLFVVPEKTDHVYKGARNIQSVTILPVGQLNAYEIIKHQTVLFSDKAIEKLQEVKNA